MKIRVLIAEDQAMVRGALAALLQTEGDFEITGQANDGQQALDLLLTSPPDVLLTDIEMPHLTGLELAGEIKRRKLPVKVVILTTFARAGYLRRALDAGVSGYLLKDGPASTLANAIRKIRGGARVVDPELAAEAWTEADPLTDRERQVLRYAGEDAASAEIASRLDLSEGTVRNYLSEATRQDGRIQSNGSRENRAAEGVAVGKRGPGPRRSPYFPSSSGTIFSGVGIAASNSCRTSCGRVRVASSLISASFAMSSLW